MSVLEIEGDKVYAVKTSKGIRLREPFENFIKNKLRLWYDSDIYSVQVYEHEGMAYCDIIIPISTGYAMFVGRLAKEDHRIYLEVYYAGNLDEGFDGYDAMELSRRTVGEIEKGTAQKKANMLLLHQ